MTEKTKIGRIGYRLDGEPHIKFRDFDRVEIDLAGDAINARLKDARRFLRLSKLTHLEINLAGKRAVLVGAA